MIDQSVEASIIAAVRVCSRTACSKHELTEAINNAFYLVDVDPQELSLANWKNVVFAAVLASVSRVTLMLGCGVSA